MPLPVSAYGAGDLCRERVAFEYRALVSDSYGNEEAATWTLAFTVAARIRPERGGETIQAARQAGREPVIITIRASSDTAAITTDWRARDVRSGKLYNIRSKVNPDERKMFFDLECDAGLAV